MLAASVLQDVAVHSSNVVNEHAPKHALNLGAPPMDSNSDMLIQSYADHNRRI
jgi:hypothetical protein